MAFQFGVDNASAALTSAERYVLSAFTVDKNLQTVTTDYTMQVGTNSVKLGDNIKLSAGNKVLCVNIDDQYYFVVLKPLEEGGGIDYLNVTGEEQTLATQTTYDTTLSSGTTAIGTQYSASYDEIVYSFTMKPASIGYMKVTIYSGTDTTGDILFNKVTQITSDLVGEDITFTDPFLLSQGDDIYVVVSGVDVLGDSNDAPYTSVVIYQASIADLQHYDAPTEDYSILQGSADGSTEFTTTPSIQTLDVLGDAITLGSTATTSTSVVVGNSSSANTITVEFLSGGESSSYDSKITATGGSSTDGEGAVRVDSGSVTLGGDVTLEKTLTVDDTATVASYTTIGGVAQTDNMLSVIGTTLLDGATVISNPTDEAGATVYGDFTTAGDIVGEADVLVQGDLTVGATAMNTEYDFYNAGTTGLIGAVTVDGVATFDSTTIFNSIIGVEKTSSRGIIFGSIDDENSVTYSSILSDYSSNNFTIATDDVIEFAHISDTSTGDQDDTTIWVDVKNSTLTIDKSSSQSTYTLYVGGDAYISGDTTIGGLLTVPIDTSGVDGINFRTSSNAIYSRIFDDGNIVIATDDYIEFRNINDGTTGDTDATNLWIDVNNTTLTINSSSSQSTYNLYNGGTSYQSGKASFAGAIVGASTLAISGTTTLASYTTIGQSTVNTGYTLYNAGTTGLNGAVTVAGATTLKSTLAVTGATTLSSTLAVTGASTLTGNTTIGGTLGVTGATTLNSTLATVGATTQGVSGSTTTIYRTNYGRDWVKGGITTGTTTNTSYTLYNGGTFYSTGAATLASTLGVTGVITGSSNAIIAGDLTVGQSSLNTSYDLYNAGTTGLSGAVTVAGVSTFNNKVNIARSSSYGLNFLNSSAYISRIYDDDNLIIATDDYIEFANISDTSTGAVSTPYIYMDVDNNTMTINKSSSQSTYQLYVGGNQYNTGYVYAYGGLVAPRTSANGLGLQFKDSTSASVYSWIFDDGNLNFSTDDYIEFSHMTAAASPSIDTPYIYMYLKSSAGYLTINNSSCNTSYNLYNGGTTYLAGAATLASTLTVSGNASISGMLTANTSTGVYYTGYTGGGITGESYVGYSTSSSGTFSSTTYSSGTTTLVTLAIPAGTWLVFYSVYGTGLSVSSRTLVAAKFGSTDNTQGSGYLESTDTYMSWSPQPYYRSSSSSGTVDLNIYFGGSVTGKLTFTYRLTRIA